MKSVPLVVLNNNDANWQYYYIISQGYLAENNILNT